MQQESFELEPHSLKSIAVGLISALVADQTMMTNRDALILTRQVVGRYSRAPMSDSTMQEITLQALYEARTQQTPEEMREQYAALMAHDKLVVAH